MWIYAVFSTTLFELEFSSRSYIAYRKHLCPEYLILKKVNRLI